MTSHVGDQTVALSLVHDVSHQGAGLPPVVVLCMEAVGGVDEFAVGLPALNSGYRSDRLPDPFELGA